MIPAGLLAIDSHQWMILLAPVSPDGVNEGIADKIAAADEFYARGYGSIASFERLIGFSQIDTTMVSGRPRIIFDELRRHALWAIGSMNRTQCFAVPTDKLPGLAPISKLIARQEEHVVIRLAAVEALWLMDRSQDRRMRSLLLNAAKAQSAEVRQAAQMVLDGRGIPSVSPSTRLPW